jgi:hypothetical protein
MMVSHVVRFVTVTGLDAYDEIRRRSRPVMKRK